MPCWSTFLFSWLYSSKINFLESLRTSSSTVCVSMCVCGGGVLSRKNRLPRWGVVRDARCPKRRDEETVIHALAQCPAVSFLVFGVTDLCGVCSCSAPLSWHSFSECLWLVSFQSWVSFCYRGINLARSEKNDAFMLSTRFFLDSTRHLQNSWRTFNPMENYTREICRRVKIIW